MIKYIDVNPIRCCSEKNKISSEVQMVGGKCDANAADHFLALLKLNPLEASASPRDCSRSCIPPTAVANTSKIDARLQIHVLLERGPNY